MQKMLLDYLHTHYYYYYFQYFFNWPITPD